MEYTDNYNLKKPNITDLYLVTVFNENMDTIDGLLKQLFEADGPAPDGVITTKDIASTTELGIVKLYNLNGTNRSGLIIQADGSLLINTNTAYGTQRTGDGKLTTAGATEAEIDAGTNEYKPITPATIKYAVEKYAKGGGITGPIGTNDIADDAVTPAKLSETYLKLYSRKDTLYNTNLNTVTDSGIYTVYAYDMYAKSNNFPIINDVQCAVGTLLVMKNEVGTSDPDASVTQLFIASGTEDTATGDGTYVSGIAVRTLKYADSAYTPVSDWTDIHGTGLAVYSATPQRIGTWIDGTPVWRLAFDRPLTPNAVNNIDIVVAKSEENVRIINRQAYATLDHNMIDTGKVADSDVDDAALIWTNYTNGTMRITKTNTGSPENYVYGYIDYATPESNLPE